VAKEILQQYLDGVRQPVDAEVAKGTRLERVVDERTAPNLEGVL
jgi:hypothetical protein